MPLESALFTSDNTNWGTPRSVFDPLNEIYRFDLDAAASTENALCSNYITEGQDCLRVKWSSIGRFAWLNPPYGERELPCGPNCKKKTCADRGWHRDKLFPGIGAFLAKALEETRFGVTTVALIPARMGSAWWRDYVHPASDLYEFPFRITFEGAKSTAPFPSALAVYRPAIVINNQPLRRWAAALS